jgi:hypothetical protein
MPAKHILIVSCDFPERVQTKREVRLIVGQDYTLGWDMILAYR